jgi:hypothetical protein
VERLEARSRCLTELAALSFGAGKAPLATPTGRSQQLPILTRTSAGVVLARNERGAVDCDDVELFKLGGFVESAAHAQAFARPEHVDGADALGDLEFKLADLAVTVRFHLADRFDNGLNDRMPLEGEVPV